MTTEGPASPSGARESRVHHPRTDDGLRIAVDDVGPESAPAIVFVHGFAQSRVSWRGVLRGALADDFRLVAFDVRGHGDSDKPEDATFYAEAGRLGADVEAVLRELGIARAVLVPWSYGGAVAGDYLRRAGDGTVAGVFATAAALRVGRAAKAAFGPGMMDHARDLMSDDEGTYRAAARAFVDDCSAVPPAPFVADGIVRAMLRVPAVARRALLSRSEDFVPQLASGAFPLTLIHGSEDRVVLPVLSEGIAREVSRAELIGLPGVGHAPFIEAKEIFEASLRAFMAKVG